MNAELSWWTAPTIQASYPLFYDEARKQAERMAIETGKVRWPIDQGIVAATKRQTQH